MKTKDRNRTVFDREAVLNALADELARIEQEDRQKYLSDLKLLDETVKQHNNEIQWMIIAQRLNVDRWKLYHWFFETFERSLSGGMEKADQARMKQLLTNAVKEGKPLDKNF